MVVVNLKRTEADQFLFECSIGDSNDKVIRDLATICNLREKVGRLVMACEELAKHGPAKPDNEQGIDDIQEKEGKMIDKGPYYSPDPLGYRNGNAPSPQLADTLRKTCNEAKEYAAAGRNQVATGIVLTVAGLQEKVDFIRGAVMMAYPMGLPDYDIIRALLDDKDDAVLRDQLGKDYHDPDTATLWWAGKEFFRDQTVGDRVGRNEKTKIVAKLQGKGSGAPSREPAVSEDERKAMMAWYFKKQEEAKQLAEDRDDTYLANEWADPKALKQNLLGTTNINFRTGFGRR